MRELILLVNYSNYETEITWKIAVLDEMDVQRYEHNVLFIR